jgi:AraC-like DNA-binding protein
MEIQTLADQALQYAIGNTDEYGIARPLPGMILFQQTRCTEFSPTLYEPVVCLILQGMKETVLGDCAFRLAPGDSLLVSHDLPVTARITEASPGKPYLAMVLSLDLSLLRGLYEEVSEAIPGGPTGSAKSVAIDKSDPRLIDCLSRFLALAGDPIETKVMAPLLMREIHFRLLMARQGGMLRELLRHDSHASNIARAISRIRRDFRTPMAVPELAREIGMSPSAFYKHFKSITAVTPLQYQKELRLLEAKRLLGVGDESVSAVAYAVGYESPTQFSREFARKFGASPSSQLG